MARHVQSRKKGLEQVRQIRSINPHARIRNLDLDPSTVRPPGTELDVSAVGRELDRVEEQIFQTVADFVCLNIGEVILFRPLRTRRGAIVAELRARFDAAWRDGRTLALAGSRAPAEERVGVRAGARLDVL